MVKKIKGKLMERTMFVLMLVTILLPYITPVIAVAETLQEPQVKLVELTLKEEGTADLTVDIDNPQGVEKSVTLTADQVLAGLLTEESTLPEGLKATVADQKLTITAAPHFSGRSVLRLKLPQKVTRLTVSNGQDQVTAEMPQAADQEVAEENEDDDADEEPAQKAPAQTEKQEAELPAAAPVRAPRAASREISTLPGADKMKTSADGPTIIDKAEIFKGGVPLKNGDKVDIGDELSLNYDWSLPEELRKNMQGGDTFTFKLPDQFKVQNAPVTGDFIEGGVKYGSFKIDADGTITYTFTDAVKNKENLKGSMSATVYIDKEHIPDKGGNEIRIPYTDGTHDVTPDIIVPKDQSIDKEVVEEGSTKSQDITDNQAVVQWRVWANKLGFPMTNGKITETLPEGVTFKDGLQVIKHQLTKDKEGVTGQTEDVTSQITMTPDATNPSKFVLSGFPAVTENDPYKYEIVFNSEVDFSQAKVSKPWGQQPTANLTNTATLNSDQDKNIQAKATKTYTSDISYDKKIDKTASKPGFDETGYKAVIPSEENGHANGVIAWDIPFTKVGLDAPAGTTIQDAMNGGQKFTDANGKIMTDAEIGALLTSQLQASGNAGKTVTVKSTVSADGQTTTYNISFPQGFSEGFNFTYYTNVMAKSGQTLNNSMKWTDNGKNDNYKVPEFSKGVKAYERDPDDKTKPLIKEDNTVTWTITVNSNYGEISNWYVEDRIVQGGKYKVGTFTVQEFTKGDSKGQTLYWDTDVKLDRDIETGTFKVTPLTKKQTNSKFVVTYQTEVDPDSPEAVSNSFIYHYTHDHTDWETGGTQEFTPNPEQQRTLNGNKSGEYFFDSTTGEDKFRWKVEVNTDEIPWGANANFYDVLEKGQVWDDTSEVKVYDDQGNDLNVEKRGVAFNNAQYPGMYWNVVRAGKNFYYGGKLNINNKATDTIVVSKFPEGESTKYTIEFVTKLVDKVVDQGQETVENTGVIQDDKNKSVKPHAEITFTRNNQSIDKVHQKLQHDDKTGVDFVPYEVIINRKKEKLTNVVVEDSGWENIEPNPATVVVKDSSGNVVDPSKYTVEKTQQQLFVSFNEEINDSYTISYDAEVQYKKGTENTVITLKNSAKVTGDGFEKTPGPTPDGYETKVPSVITSVTGDTPTTKLIVNKIDPSEDGSQPKPLKGVLFTLYQAGADANGVIYENGKAKIKETILKDIATGADGKAIFDKLEKGYYFLVETKTVANYLINNEYRSHTNSNGQIDPGYLIEIFDTEQTPELTIDVENMSIPIKGQKSWADDGDSRKKRPAAITVRLFRENADGTTTEVASQEVTAANNWAYVFDNQPAQDANGKDIHYTVKEDPVPGYESLYNGTNIVNSILTDIEAQKVWDDHNDRNGDRTKTVTFTLQKETRETTGLTKIVDVLDDQGKPMTVTIGAAENWRHTFSQLPKYDRFGKEIEYKIKEEPVPGYNHSMERDAEGNFIVTNYNPPATTDVNGAKTWKDNNNKDGKRPGSIFIQLMKQVTGSPVTVATDLDDQPIPVKEVKAADQWAWTFSKVPKYEQGQEIVYSVREVEKSGNDWVPVRSRDYTSEAQGMDVTNTQNVELKGHKQWFDSKNAEGFRPDKLQVILQQSTDGGQTWSDVAGQSTTATGPDWSYQFSNQPKYLADGVTEIKYKVREAAVPGGKGDLSKYTQDDPDAISMDLSNTYDSQNINISGVKTWDDSENVAGARPKEITLRLKKKAADGTWVQAQDANGKDQIKTIAVGTADITYSFMNLPKYDKGEEIQYRIEEDEVAGYSAAVSGDNTKIVNSNPPVETTVKGEKTWQDGNDQDGKRPKSIKLQLMRHIDGEKPVVAVDVKNQAIPVKTVTPTDGKWTYSFEHLPKYYKGQEVIYSVKEVEPAEGYTPTNDENDPMMLTNSRKPEETQLKGTKEWDDGNDQDGKRPASITVILQQQDEQGNWTDVPGQSKTVTAANKWTYTFTGLPKNRKGQPINYRVREDVSQLPKGYQSAYKDADEVDLVNSYTPETIKFKGVKSWDDQDNKAGFRPIFLKVTFTLQHKVGDTWLNVPGVDPVHPSGVQDAKQWQFAFDAEVPKYEQGKLIEYRIVENGLKDYTYRVMGQSDEVDANKASLTHREVQVTNTNPPIVIEVGGTKTWSDANDQDGVRPQSVNFKLYKQVNGQDVEVKVDADDQPITNAVAQGDPQDPTKPWQFKFGNLPKYENGEQVKYILKEVGTPGGYTMSLTDQTESIEVDPKAPTVLAVTNSREPEVTEVSGEKTWQDDDDRDGLRPQEITVTLQKQQTDDQGDPVVPEAWEDVLVDGKPLTQTAKAPDWGYRFSDLPKNSHGKAITYRVKETPVAGYTSANSSTDPMDLTNTHTPEITKINGKKIWRDHNADDQKRPKSITVKVMKLTAGKLVQAQDIHGQDLVKTITPTQQEWAQDEWSYEFTDLYKYEDGKMIEYFINEEPIRDQDGVELYSYEMSIASGGSQFDATITNTSPPETTEVEGTKTWQDNDDQDGKRLKEIKVRLMRQIVGEKVEPAKDFNGELIPVQTVTDAEDWHYTFKGLPKNAKGVPITYTVEEVDLDAKTGYRATPTGMDLTNSRTPETYEVKGKKTWQDDQDRDGKRPVKFNVILQAQDAAGNWQDVPGQVTEAAAPDYEYRFERIPRYRAGEEIKYRVREEAIPEVAGDLSSYKLTYDAADPMNITNTYTPEKTTFEGKKIWEDKGDQDGLRPTELQVQLMATVGHTTAVAKDFAGKEIPAETLRAADQWTFKWKDLPMYQEGQEITYHLEEVKLPAGYTKAYTAAADGGTLTNTHIPEETKINGRKIWKDNGDQDGKRPQSITVKLLADGQVVAEKVVTAADDTDPDNKDQWTYAFTGLPKYKDGKEIQYTIDEVTVPEYSGEIKGHDITNTHTPELTQVRGTKTWVDNDDQDGKRPKQLTVKLLADGQVVQEKDITAAENWSYTFDNLPMYQNGKVIQYTIDEVTVPEYSGEIKGHDITNTHTPGKTEIRGTKQWDDLEDIDGLRPTEIIVKLMKGTEEVARQTVTAADNWRYVFTDLPMYEAGEPITYTIDEEAVAGYEKTVAGHDLVNRHQHEVTEIAGEKKWVDQKDQYRTRPEAIVVKLLADGKEVKSKTVTAADNWRFTFTELPKLSQGKEINYTVAEVPVPGYQTEVAGTTITNKLETTEINGRKVWVDQNNAKKRRPTGITVALLANGQQIAKQTVTAKEDWRFSFKELPTVDAKGQLITYTVKELNVPTGYLVKIDGTTITNTLSDYPKTGEKVSSGLMWAGVALVAGGGGFLIWRSRRNKDEE